MQDFHVILCKIENADLLLGSESFEVEPIDCYLIVYAVKETVGFVRGGMGNTYRGKLLRLLWMKVMHLEQSGICGQIQKMLKFRNETNVPWGISVVYFFIISFANSSLSWGHLCVRTPIRKLIKNVICFRPSRLISYVARQSDRYVAPRKPEQYDGSRRLA